MVKTDMAFLYWFVFLLYLYHELCWAGLGWGGVGKGEGCSDEGWTLESFPPCAVNINTRFTVSTAAAGIGGPGWPFA